MQISTQPKSPQTTKIITDFEIVRRYPREGRLYFTQGLVFKDADTLLESGGLYGESTIQYVNISDMNVTLQQNLDPKYFGEGCDIVKVEDKEYVYQLTYMERKILVWDSNTLELKREVDMQKEIAEGWGMAKRIIDEKDNKRVELYISDGSDRIYVMDPETFQIIKTIKIFASNTSEVNNLNELEFVNGKLWANIFLSNYVAVIDPEIGFVEAFIDFSRLEKEAKEKAKERGDWWDVDTVLNGIAYHSETNRLLMTGKMWSLMWEINVKDL